MVKFIALPKLPSAKETADLGLCHIFFEFWIPQGCVFRPAASVQARFWTAFCQLLGATVSLSSGYHPQTNGQMERMNQEFETGS